MEYNVSIISSSSHFAGTVFRNGGSTLLLLCNDGSIVAEIVCAWLNNLSSESMIFRNMPGRLSINKQQLKDCKNEWMTAY